jgi:hypothetical protein
MIKGKSVRLWWMPETAFGPAVALPLPPSKVEKI